MKSRLDHNVLEMQGYGLCYICFRCPKSGAWYAWNAMIAGFFLSDQVKEAWLVFGDMAYSEVEPNNVTVVTYLSLFACVANLQHR